MNKRGALGSCAGVLWTHCLVATTNIGNSYASAVMTLTVGTGLLLWASSLNSSVKQHYIMIAYCCKSSINVPSGYILNRYISTLWSCCTVNYNLIYRAHTI